MNNNENENIILQILKKEYNTNDIKKIGYGSFGGIYNINNKRCVKIFVSDNYNSFQKSDLENIHFCDMEIFREIFFNKTINHKYIYKFDKIKYNDILGYYLEGNLALCDLITYVKNGKFEIDDFFILLERMIDILKYLHGIGLIHCDIKPANILVFDDGFYLCDLTIMQYFDTILDDDDVDVFSIKNIHDLNLYKKENYKKIFTIKDYSVEGENKTFLSDIYTLGCTLFVCLMPEKRRKGIINKNMLEENKDVFFIKYGNNRKTHIVYEILNMMIEENLDKRIYINKLEKIIYLTKYTDIDKVDEINRLFNNKKHNFINTNEEFRQLNHKSNIKKIYDDVISDDYIKSYDTFYYNNMEKYMMEYRDIGRIKSESKLLKEKRCLLITRLGYEISKFYDVSRKIAEYIIHCIIDYPYMIDIKNIDIDIIEFNKAIIKILNNKNILEINYHIYTCFYCYK